MSLSQMLDFQEEWRKYVESVDFDRIPDEDSIMEDLEESLRSADAVSVSEKVGNGDVDSVLKHRGEVLAYCAQQVLGSPAP